MSLERLHPQESQKALGVYLSAISHVSDVLPVIQRSLNNASPQLVNTSAGSFAKFRELWRWSERLLRRAIILTAQTGDPLSDETQTESFWNLQSLYRGCSALWPSTFRPELRSTVATIHLRAFVLRTRQLPSDILRAKTPRWISTARSVLQELRALLSVCTQFPRAGERNTRVEDFVDLCVAVWEADGAVGEYAGWAIDVSTSSASPRSELPNDECCYVSSCGGPLVSRLIRSASIGICFGCCPHREILSWRNARCGCTSRSSARHVRLGVRRAGHRLR